MKKLLAILSTIALALVITACGGAQETTPTQGTTDQQQQEQQQQGQQSGGTQNADASQSATAGQQQDQQQQADTTPDTPAENANVVLFNEFIAEYARVNLGRMYGISNGVAYWHMPGSRGFILHDMNTGQTYTLDTDRELDFTFVHWNGYIFARDGRFGSGTAIMRFDMQGNLINEYSVDGRRISSFQIQGGNILVRGSYDGGPVRLLDVISARDFSTVRSPLILTRYVGHGRTEEVTGLDLGNLHILLGGYDSVFFGGLFGPLAGWHVIDLLTGESQQVDYVASGGNTGRAYGRFFIVDAGAGTPEIINTETGEGFVFDARFDNRFTGTNFHRIHGEQEVQRYNPVTMDYEVIFVAPNPRSQFIMLNDNYVIVQDNVGMFLYRFVDGNVNGEFVREIILP